MLVSFYGDNHPRYAGSVVKAMASAREGYLRVADLSLLNSGEHPASLAPRPTRFQDGDGQKKSPVFRPGTSSTSAVTER